MFDVRFLPFLKGSLCSTYFNNNSGCYLLTERQDDCGFCTVEHKVESLSTLWLTICMIWQICDLQRRFLLLLLTVVRLRVCFPSVERKTLLKLDYQRLTVRRMLLSFLTLSKGSKNVKCSLTHKRCVKQRHSAEGCSPSDPARWPQRRLSPGRSCTGCSR